MKTFISRILPLLITVLIFPGLITAQDNQTEQEPLIKFRTDAEIIAGLEVYVANMDAAYVDMRDERDALKDKVAELEAALQAERESQEN